MTTRPSAVLDRVGFTLLLQLVTEDRMAAGLDADGSATCGRALQILGGWDRIGEACDPKGPWSKDAAGARAAMRRWIRRAEPLLARTARTTPGD